jgi:hypothetical protein
MTQTRTHQMQDAIALLQDATNQIYNIEGQVWQLSYELLEAIIANLQVELGKEQTTEGKQP